MELFRYVLWKLDLMWGYADWSIFSFVDYFRFHWSNPPSLPFSFLSSLLSAPINARSTLGHSKVASLLRSSCAQVRFVMFLWKYDVFSSLFETFL